MTTMQTRYLGKINRLKTLQHQVCYWEQTLDNYKKTLAVFQDYIDCLREFQDPRSLVNGYIRMAKYCENMEDRLMSREILKDAKQIMLDFNLAGQAHLHKLQKKIDSLCYYY